MNDVQFKELCNKLDKLYGLIAVQSIADRNDKVYALKSMGFSSEDIGVLVSMKNVRTTEGWKRK